jgi:hypothetical protein
VDKEPVLQRQVRLRWQAPGVVLPVLVFIIAVIDTVTKAFYGFDLSHHKWPPLFIPYKSFYGSPYLSLIIGITAALVIYFIFRRSYRRDRFLVQTAEEVEGIITGIKIGFPCQMTVSFVLQGKEYEAISRSFLPCSAYRKYHPGDRMRVFFNKHDLSSSMIYELNEFRIEKF